MVPRVLLLENVKENAAPIVSHLEQLDWQVDFVQDGIEALVLGLTKHFELRYSTSTSWTSIHYAWCNTSISILHLCKSLE